MRFLALLLFLSLCASSYGQKYRTVWLDGITVPDSLTVMEVSSDSAVSRICLTTAVKGKKYLLISDHVNGITWSQPYVALKLPLTSLHGRLTADGSRIILIKDIDERTGPQVQEVKPGVLVSLNSMGVYVSELLGERTWSAPHMLDDYFFFNQPPHSISMSPSGRNFIFSNFLHTRKKVEMLNYSTVRNEQNKWIESSRFEIPGVHLAEQVKDKGIFVGSVVHQNETTLLVNGFDGTYTVPFDGKKAGTPTKIDFYGGNIEWINPSGSIGIMLSRSPLRVGLVLLKGTQLPSMQVSQPLAVNNEREQTTASTEEESKSVKPTGKYVAVLIGVSSYDNSRLNLNQPAKDVAELKELLTSNYMFDPANVQSLINPTRQQIINLLFKLRNTIGVNDNLLIFYAGHGHYDKAINQGYWWPRDASPDDPSNWLSNSDLREQIRGIKSGHTLLISDACFSGGIFRTRGVEEVRTAPREIITLYKTPSRRAITSGNLSSVPDQSVFFEYLKKRLTENQEKYLPSQQLFAQLKLPVMNNSSTNPQEGVILDAGDEGGDFIFMRR